MPLVALALILLLPLVVIALLPLVLIQRYRVGTMRRLARPWLATLNLVGMVFSVLFFLTAAAFTNFWVPGAFASSAAGVAAGCLLGAVGLLITRWESTPGALHYTPNKWLVLTVTLVVTGRLLYGFFRGWMTLQSAGDNTTWFHAFGVAGSMAAGAVVIGYYLAYAIGLRLRIRRWQRRALRRM